ncbi:MAG: primosomal protein N' [Chloroflexi bacterium]|nr:primosomal protein N' [Chloroflexota bacterium]
MRFADVVVISPTKMRDYRYTYVAPDSMADVLELGSMVVVPFGRHVLHGILTNFHRDPPPFDTREILGTAAGFPVLTPEQIDLAEWISAYYHCPLKEAMLLLIPARLRRRPDKVFYLLTLPQDTRLPSEDMALAAWIQTNGPATLERLKKAGLARGLPARLARMERSGFLQSRWLVREPSAALVRPPKPFPEKVMARSGVPPVLSVEQGAAWSAISSSLSAGDRQVFLLHGVTGSGKTELYLRAVGQVLRNGKSALILVPEVSLTPQAIAALEARFPNEVAAIHSRVSDRQRWQDWQRIRDGKTRVVVGARSALFAPLRNLGLVIVDEEHEWTYKSDETPRYHARTVATKLAELHGATTVLSSATPDVVSYYKAVHGDYKLLTLKSRVVGAGPGMGGYAPAKTEMPRVEIVDMREELRAGNSGIISSRLRTSIASALRSGGQVILFLNRRGSSTLLLCRGCGKVFRCSACESTLVYHKSLDALLCHRCGRRLKMPSTCPSCGAGMVASFGVGTERLEEEARRTFPTAGILRWDSDAAKAASADEDVLSRFAEGQADILVGTQLVAKGLDFPRVMLVAAVMADTSLFVPDFRAAERTFQLLTQAGGRAGRRRKPGKMIIQTYCPDHYAIRAAAAHDYLAFYQQEIRFRKHWNYPPFGQMVRFVYAASQDSRAQAEAERLAQCLGSLINPAGQSSNVILGPAPCFLHHMRGRYRWQVILVSPDAAGLLAGWKVPAGWVVDVDPVNIV